MNVPGSGLVHHEWRENGIVIVTLNRPEARNALSRQLTAEIHRLVLALALEDTLRVVILTGTGERAFCAGADLIERQTMSPTERTAHTDAIASMVEAVAVLPVPVIGALRGFVLAGGAELALACDLRVGEPTTVIGFPEVRIGIFPGAGGVTRLPRLIGASAASDLLFSGRQIDANESFRMGILDAVVPQGEALDRAYARAEEIAANAPLAVRAVKLALRESAGLPLAEANEVVRRRRQPLDATSDYAEGLAAFSEKRRPRFIGH